MTKEQRKRVESLFHELLDLPAAQRKDYLAQDAADESVKQQAASLVHHYETQDELDQISPGTQDLAFETPVPDQIGKYEVIGRLGKGGMGEVYLAYDPELQRNVAIKILPALLADDPDAVQRLKHEAQAASSLSHPNIVAVFEFVDGENGQFIVTEYVPGQSLRELIGSLNKSQALDYARQIGGALAAAHAAGIIHRDIKPENIMVRPDGLVKVLDFGLAKVARPPAHATGGGENKAVQISPHTTPGTLVGTISYMSPEQARGEEVDRRTDIWSWGVVLYEMLMGRRPFQGLTPDELRMAIRERNPELPRSEQSIHGCLKRALAKDRSERYSTIEEALEELQGQKSIRHVLADLIPFVLRTHPVTWALVVLVLCAATAGVYRSFLRPGSRANLANVVRLSNSGDVVGVAISPEGEYVAYTTKDGGGQHLHLRQVSTSADTVKVSSEAGEFIGLTINGGYIYYVLSVQSTGTLYRTPLLEGPAKLLKVDVDSPVSFAPDSSQYVFLRYIQKGDKRVTALILCESLTNAESVLAQLDSHEHFWSAPLWSHDGKSVVSESYDDASPTLRFVSISLKDGQRRVVPGGPWSYLRKAAWLRGGSVIVPATPMRAMKSELTQVFMSDGRSQQVSGGLAVYSEVDSSSNGERIVALQHEVYFSIWLVPVTGQQDLVKLPGSGLHLSGLAWSASGSLISQSESGGRPDLVTIDPGSGSIRSLTDDEHAKTSPEATPDGRYIIYSSNRDGTFHMWRADKSGGQEVRLTASSSAEEEGVATPDSKWVVFTALHDGIRTLWKVPIEGGSPTAVTQHWSAKPSVSPDGSLIACEYLDETANVFRIALLRASDGQFIRFLPQIPTPARSRVRWSANGKALYYVAEKNGVGNVWEQPMDGGIPHQLTHFAEDEIFTIAASPDGTRLACLRGRRIADAILARVAYN